MEYKTLEIWCTGILMVWMAGIILLERLFPYRKNMPFFREGFWIDFVWYTLIQSYFLKILIFDFIITPADKALNLSSLHIVTDWPLWVQVLFFLVIHDFYIYWFHRAQHHFPFLWRTHEAHHSVKHVDWLAGSRSHVLEIVINQTIEFAPIILLGASPEVVPIKALLDATWGMYIHSNINVRSGKLQYIINGPEMHLWHHADENEVYHANFSTKFAFWDWMFGSAYLPDRKPIKWGLWYDYPRDYFMQHWFSFFRFDVRKTESSPQIKKYLDFRINFLNSIGWKTDNEYDRFEGTVPVQSKANPQFTEE